jgi:hypothetical protein
LASKSASFIGAILAACIAVASCSPAFTPSADFLERIVALIYPSGLGVMGYNVKHLVDICVEGKGQVSWEKSDSDIILTCDGTDPLTKARIHSRWLMRPSEAQIPNGAKFPAVAIMGLAINGQNISRSDLEVFASNL